MNQGIKTTLLNAARDGDRLEITVDGKTKRLWAGLGNRSGLHHFASELVWEKYNKGANRLIAKLEKLAEGTEVRILQFQNINRDRGRWVVTGMVVR